MSRITRVSAGAALLIANAAQWVFAEAVTARAWATPPYSYATNYISDLGVPDCGTQFQGRDICSPLHGLMNTSFAAEGVLFAVGVALLASGLRGRVRRTVVTLAAAHGIGMILVGLFHGSPDGPSAGLVLHIAGAGIGILCANAISILVGASGHLSRTGAYRIFSVAIGAIGLAGIALVGVSPETAGLFERLSVYSWLSWSVVTGVLVLAGRSTLEADGAH